MKYLKKYKLFEYVQIDIDDWFDVRAVIQSDILDKYHISTNSIHDTNEDSKYVASDPKLTISYNNLEMSPYIIDDIYELNSRIYEMTKHFIVARNNVNSIKQNIEIKLSKVPDTRIIIHHFNLEETYEFDNLINKVVGGFCDYDTAIKILEWLNSFYKFCYRTELDAFKSTYDTLKELYNVELIFSMTKFEDERFSQVVCFNFKLSDGVKKVLTNKHPIFVIDTNHTESPLIYKRTGNYNYKQLSFNYNNISNYLTNEEF